MYNNKFIDCIHKNCVTNSLPGEERGHLFCLPTSNILREQWLKKMNRLDLLALPYNSLPKYRVCKLHFNNYDFYTPEKKKLIRGRIPLDINQHVPRVNTTGDFGMTSDESNIFEPTPGPLPRVNTTGDFGMTSDESNIFEPTPGPLLFTKEEKIVPKAQRGQATIEPR